MSFFRPNIAALAAYVPGEQPQTDGFVKLNTNENPYPPSPRVLEAIVRSATDRLRRYPDPVARRFRETAAEALGLDARQIVPCNGSDEALTLLTRACLDPSDLMAAPTPSYLLYRVLAEIQGCRYEEKFFTNEWDLPNDFASASRLAFLPNPNSPSGTLVPTARVRILAENAGGLLAIDEAYADFANDNCLSLVGKVDRLVVTRSLSKGYGLAGIRFGFVVAPAPIADRLLAIKDSYNCDAVSIAAAAAALADQAYLAETRAKIIATRARLSSAMEALGFRVTPSQANFVWARLDRPTRPMYEALKERKILVRSMTYPNYGEGLRVTVGTDAEIDQFLDALPKAM